MMPSSSRENLHLLLLGTWGHLAIGGHLKFKFTSEMTWSWVGTRKRLFLLFLGCSPLLVPIQSKGSSRHPFRGPHIKSCPHATQTVQSTTQSLSCPWPHFQMPSRERQPQILAPLLRLLSFHRSWPHNSSLTYTLSRAMLNTGVGVSMLRANWHNCFRDALLINTPIASTRFIFILCICRHYTHSLFGALLRTGSLPLILSSSALFYLHQVSNYFSYFRNLLKALIHRLLSSCSLCLGV